MLFHTAALPASAVVGGAASCHPFPVLAQENMVLPMMLVPAQLCPSLPGAIQGCAALCEVSLRQGHRKLVTAHCLASRFGEPLALMLLVPLPLASGAAVSGAPGAEQPLSTFLLIAFLAPPSRRRYPCVRSARDLRAGTSVGGERSPRPAVVVRGMLRSRGGGWAENNLGTLLMMLSHMSR